MKKSLVSLVLLTALLVIPGRILRAEETGTPQPEGSGLQPSIFSSVRALSPDYAKNTAVLFDYTLTPGDGFTLYINHGVTSDQYKAIVSEYKVYLSHDYSLTIPYLGKINARDMTLQELQNHVITSISRIVPTEYVNFLLTEPAQYTVFVYGAVNLPGSFIVNPLIRIIDAIGMAKGFKDGASYRTVQLIRNGKTIALDISKFYTQADFSANPPLQPGDKVFVPQASIIAQISGAVTYPGIYELVPGETLQDLISFAGTFEPGANTAKIEISRIDETGKRTLCSVSLDESDSFAIRNGDTVAVRYASENNDTVTIEGAIYGKRISGTSALTAPMEPIRIEIPYYPGISLLSVLDIVGGPTPYARLAESFIRRKGEETTTPVHVEELWKTRDLALDIELTPGDYVCVPIQNLMVFVSGAVTDPGGFPYRSDFTVWDYIMLAGGPKDNQAAISRIFFVSETGQKTPVKANDLVPPGSVIFMEKNALFKSDQAMQNVFIVTGWITTITALVQSIIYVVYYYNRLKP